MKNEEPIQRKKNRSALDMINQSYDAAKMLSQMDKSRSSIINQADVYI